MKKEYCSQYETRWKVSIVISKIVDRQPQVVLLLYKLIVGVDVCFFSFSFIIYF